MKPANGGISIGDLLSFSYSKSGSGGDGGAIAFTALGNITTGGINSEAGGTGNGGDITLTSNAGAIDTTSGAIASQIREGSDGTGLAGTIVFTAKDNIQTASLDASAEKGDSGSIQLTSTNGEIDTTQGTLYTDSRNGNGGAISLEAANDITTGDLNSFSKSLFGSTRNGGQIIITSNNGNITTQILDSSSYSSDNALDGGAIKLRANGSINTGSLFSASFSNSGSAGSGVQLACKPPIALTSQTLGTQNLKLLSAELGTLPHFLRIILEKGKKAATLILSLTTILMSLVILFLTRFLLRVPQGMLV